MMQRPIERLLALSFAGMLVWLYLSTGERNADCTLNFAYRPIDYFFTMSTVVLTLAALLRWLGDLFDVLGDRWRRHLERRV